MQTTIWGVVKDGRIVPSEPLPEGARVEIRLCDVPAELQSELDSWQRASSDALQLVERLAQESEANEKR